MSGNLIFHLLEDPSETWAEDYDLVHCFYKNNPFWTNEGLPLDTEDEDRQYFIDELADELPNGYSIENETISISMGYKDFPETFKHHIQDFFNDPDSEANKTEFPLGWFKRELGGVCGILIWYEEALYTLPEFLFYLAGLEVGELQNPGKLYIGSIFEYCF